MYHFISYNYFYLLPLFFSTVFSLRFFRLNALKQLKIFSILLLITAIVETFAISWKWGLCKTRYWQYTPSNLWVYNAFVPVRHILLLWFISSISEAIIVRKAIKFSIFPFLGFSIFNYWLIQTPHAINSYSIILANIITVCFLITVLVSGIESNSTKAASIKWICRGSLFYYAVSLPLFISLNFIMRGNLSTASHLFYINDTLNIIMYSSYLISVLCRRPSMKQSSLS